MKCLKIDDKWLKLILAGVKTWEIRRLQSAPHYIGVVNIDKMGKSLQARINYLDKDLRQQILRLFH